MVVGPGLDREAQGQRRELLVDSSAVQPLGLLVGLRWGLGLVSCQCSF